MSKLGFRGRISVNDGASNADRFFDDVMTIKLPDRAYGEYEEKRLHTDSRDKIKLPTLLDNGVCQVKGYWSKAEYLRILALQGVTGKAWKIYEPVETGTPPLLCTIDGWLQKVSDTTFEKDTPMEVMMEICVNSITMDD